MGISSPDFLQLPALLISQLFKSDEDCAKIHDLLKTRREFRDGMLQKALLDALHQLIEHEFTADEIHNLLKSSLKGNVKANLMTIRGCLDCDGKDALKLEAQKVNSDLGTAYQNAFAKIIPIKHVENFSTKYAETFGKSELPSAPLTYAGRLRRLQKSDREIALNTFGSFIHSVLEGEYAKKRYSKQEGLGEGVDHLQFIFDKIPALKEQWVKRVENPLEEYFTGFSKSSFDTQDFLKTKILDHGHLSKEQYPDLFYYLKTGEEKIAAGLAEELQKAAVNDKKKIDIKKTLSNSLGIIKDIEKAEKVDERIKLLKTAARKLSDQSQFQDICKHIESLSISMRKESKKADKVVSEEAVMDIANELKQHLQAEIQKLAVKDEGLKKLQIQKDLIDLWKAQNKPEHQKMSLLKKIHEELSGSGEEFLNDVKGVIKAIEKQKQNSAFEEYIITNTDNWDDMLLCGTQVQGSCQRIDGIPDLNKCLLAYLLDGKNRMIAIKDKSGKEGKIVARSILRLLWDNKSQRPALMQEKVYSNILDKNVNTAIDNFAKAEAERLGLELYRFDDLGDAELESFGSVAPWEYVDSSGGVNPKGKFTITKARLVVSSLF